LKNLLATKSPARLTASGTEVLSVKKENLIFLLN